MIAASAIIEAKYPEDVFGTPMREDQAEQTLTFAYRRLVRYYHPDNQETGDEEVFKALQPLYEAAKRALAEGKYGQRETIAQAVLITTKRHAYTVDKLIHKGSLAAIYSATYPGDDQPLSAVLKVVREPKDGPQVAQEAKVLKALLQQDSEMYDLISPYLPAYIEAFGYRHNGATRQAIAFAAEYPVVSLEDVQRAYPDGVHPKDSAWMLRRLFMMLGLTHASGWVHRQVNERHIMIQPKEHGLMLVDWTKATEAQRQTTGHDLADAIRSIENITAMRLAPTRYRRFIEGCQVGSHRLPDGFTLLDEYNELIEDLWGPRKFRPFQMPNQ